MAKMMKHNKGGRISQGATFCKNLCGNFCAFAAQPQKISIVYHFTAALLTFLSLFHPHVIDGLTKSLPNDINHFLNNQLGHVYHRVAWFVTYAFAARQCGGVFTLSAIKGNQFLQIMTFVAFLQFSLDLIVDGVGEGFLHDPKLPDLLGAGGSSRNQMYAHVMLTNILAGLFELGLRRNVFKVGGAKKK